VKPVEMMTELNTILRKIPLKEFFWSLINGSAGCTNALIGQANISKLTNFHHSVLFARKKFIAAKDFLHPCINELRATRFEALKEHVICPLLKVYLCHERVWLRDKHSLC
jgi:hypothetical protein